MEIEKIISDCYSEELAIGSQQSFNEVMEIIYNNYHAKFKARFDSYLEYYKTIGLEDAIRCASLGIYKLNGKTELTWFHQQTFIKYNGIEPLDQLTQKLYDLRSRIITLKDFHHLFILIREVSLNINNIGPLSVYDTALRLGSHLNLFPDYIYLHAGTVAGYKILIDEKSNKEFIEKGVVRTIPYLNILEPKYVEDILCIYKKTFMRIKYTSDIK